MKVRELIQALQKAKNQEAPVTVLDKQGDFEADISTVDEDGEAVHIVIEQWPSL